MLHRTLLFIHSVYESVHLLTSTFHSTAPSSPPPGQPAVCSLCPCVCFMLFSFSRSVMSDSLRPHGLQHARPPAITNSWSLLKLMSVESNDAMQPSYPLSSPSPAFSLSQHQSLFQWVRWPKYWSFSFNISPFNEYPGLIWFRIDWFDLIAVQGTFKSLLQHHSSKASIPWCSAFFIVQLSHPYMTTGKTIALTKWTFVGKVISVLFNMLSRLVIGFLPRSKCLYFMAAVTIYNDFGAPQNKVCHCFHCFPISLPRTDGTGS